MSIQQKWILERSAIGFAALILLFPACTSITAHQNNATETDALTQFTDRTNAAGEGWARCMRERGHTDTNWNGVSHSFGGTGLAMTPQSEADWVACDELYPFPSINSGMSASAWTRFYTAVVEWARCREEFGNPLAAQPPSIQTLVDWALHNDGVWGPWSPDLGEWIASRESQAVVECGSEPIVMDFLVE
jgi:hypothetical protein